MGFFSSLMGRGNSIDSITLDELKITEIKLNKKVEEISAEIKRNDLEVQRAYEQAKESTSKSEEVSYARRIKTLLQKKDMLISSQSQNEKDLRVVSNLIISKRRKKDLSSDVMAKIDNIDPEKIERDLISDQVDADIADKKKNQILDITSSTMDVGVEPEDDLADIIDTIRSGKEESVTASPEPAKVKKTNLE